MNLIDPAGERVLFARSDAVVEPAIAGAAKDADSTARWIEGCLSGREAIPESLKVQLACCLVASGEAQTLEEGMARVAATFG
jgi:anthranilate phosphoribosyltransferase